jgi:hypothetical protein
MSTVPNAVSIASLLRLSDARKIKDTIEGRFGEDVHVHRYSGVWAVIWKSNDMPEDWKMGHM